MTTFFFVQNDMTPLRKTPTAQGFVAERAALEAAQVVGRWWMGGQVSNEKNLGCLGYIGDEKLPSYMGIILNHIKPL